MKVGNGLSECSTEDLCRIWYNNNELGLLVNRAQRYREDGEDAAEYILINVSETSQGKGRRGFWVRFTSGSLNNLA